jgi:hypothetical protein
MLVGSTPFQDSIDEYKKPPSFESMHKEEANVDVAL